MNKAILIKAILNIKLVIEDNSLNVFSAIDLSSLICLSAIETKITSFS